jgi:hypothetical protein
LISQNVSWVTAALNPLGSLKAVTGLTAALTQIKQRLRIAMPKPVADIADDGPTRAVKKNLLFGENRVAAILDAGTTTTFEQLFEKPEGGLKEHVVVTFVGNLRTENRLEADLGSCGSGLGAVAQERTASCERDTIQTSIAMPVARIVFMP